MAEKEVRLVDANVLLTELAKGTIRPTNAYEEGIMAGVRWSKEIVQKMPTIDPESLKDNKRTLLLDEVYRVIAGHSNYHGDNILAALTCIAEGKIVKPVRPLESLRPQWISVVDRVPETIPCNAGTEYSEAVIVWTSGKKAMVAVWNGTRFLCAADYWEAWDEEITHWMPLPKPPNCGAKMDKED